VRNWLQSARTLLSIVLPFLIPVLALGVWLVSESVGQPSENADIIASIDASGTGTTYLSTLLADGNLAVWRCSAGSFSGTGADSARGRSVTWQPDPGFSDSVTIIVSTPTSVDSVRFLPFIPSITPTITVSAAYHLAVMDRSRDVTLPSGRYRVVVEDDNLQGYDGVVALVCHAPGEPRRALAASPGDTLSIDLPLGGTVEAVGLDHTETALDNGGSVLVTFLRDST
jgi:hypothetical protein